MAKEKPSFSVHPLGEGRALIRWRDERKGRRYQICLQVACGTWDAFIYSSRLDAEMPPVAMHRIDPRGGAWAPFLAHVLAEVRPC